jgi:aerobic carbon-monoxide dehydrogenase small subunit
VKVDITVNGERTSADVEPRTLLAHYLRENVGLKATNIGCDTTSCGACTVLVDGESVKSCTVLAVQVDEQSVQTMEDLGIEHKVTAAFRQEHGLQCGFCTPGMLMTSRALLDENPDPSEQEIRVAISGQICRCTGYENIVRSVKAAAQLQRDTQEVQA